MYDCIVVGVGGMGSAAVYQLAIQGAKVLGLEQFALGHDRGASHGQTRIIRQAYFEHPDYVPLLKRSYALWEALEKETGEKLFERPGLVYYGAPSSSVLSGVKESSRLYQVPLDAFPGANAQSLYPELRPAEGFQALLEKNAGFLAVESCVLAHARAARARGAVIHENEKYVKHVDEQSYVRVVTDKGEYKTQKLILTEGPWARRFLPLQLHRQLLFWFEAPESYRKIPCFIFDMPYGFYYGFPKLDERGVKIAHHSPGEPIVDLAMVDRTLRKEDSLLVERCVRECLPGLGKLSQFAVCIYSMSPDEHFMVDLAPDSKRTYFAAGFSGHGFKFASVIGEILAELALHGKTQHPISLFRANRFSK